MALFLLQYLKYSFYLNAIKFHGLWFKNSWLFSKAKVYLLEKHRGFVKKIILIHIIKNELKLVYSSVIQDFLNVGLFQGVSIKKGVRYCGMLAGIAVWYDLLAVIIKIFEYHDTFKFDSKNQLKVSSYISITYQLQTWR